MPNPTDTRECMRADENALLPMIPGSNLDVPLLPPSRCERVNQILVFGGHVALSCQWKPSLLKFGL